MQSAKIIEIFSSIQGEGKFLGTKQIFVRFFKCNMHCHWCDTPNSIGDDPLKKNVYNILSVQETQNEINKLWQNHHSISLTGGEPLLHTDFIKNLICVPNNKNRSFHLETNGTLPDELLKISDDIDVISMDIKPPSSTLQKSYWEEHIEFIKISKTKSKADLFIKVVITKDTHIDDIKKIIEIIKENSPDTLLIIQPNSFDLKKGVIKLCLDYHELCSKFLHNVRLIPQNHRFLKLR